jgi:hypothetical protein
MDDGSDERDDYYHKEYVANWDATFVLTNTIRAQKLLQNKVIDAIIAKIDDASISGLFEIKVHISPVTQGFVINWFENKSFLITTIGEDAFEISWRPVAVEANK